MNRMLVIFCALLSTSCASWHDVKAPCTYDNRLYCGELIYSNENPQLAMNVR